MPPPFDGILVIDKPTGITSRAAVDRAQTWFPRGTRIGHTGTLDPLATGVLVLCVGVATRLTEYVQGMPKVYRAGITLGASSDTDDADGTITQITSAVPPTRDLVERELASFIGTIEQVPPAFSAAKVSGRRAYDLARKGKEVRLTPRPVTIERIDVVRFAYPHLEIVVRCGKGTYIRSLARDLGQRLGTGGYIASLRRLGVGPFTEKIASTLDMDATTAQDRLLPPWRALQDWEPTRITDAEAIQLRNGRRIPHTLAAHDDLGHFAVINNQERTFAVVTAIDGCLQPVKVLVPGET